MEDESILVSSTTKPQRCGDRTRHSRCYHRRRVPQFGTLESVSPCRRCRGTRRTSRRCHPAGRSGRSQPRSARADTSRSLRGGRLACSGRTPLRGVSGMAYHGDESGHIDLCAPETLFVGDGLPLATRRTVLHELGHLWTVGHTDDSDTPGVPRPPRPSRMDGCRVGIVGVGGRRRDPRLGPDGRTGRCPGTGHIVYRPVHGLRDPHRHGTDPADLRRFVSRSFTPGHHPPTVSTISSRLVPCVYAVVNGRRRCCPHLPVQ